MKIEHSFLQLLRLETWEAMKRDKACQGGLHSAPKHQLLLWLLVQHKPTICHRHPYHAIRCGADEVALVSVPMRSAVGTGAVRKSKR